MFPAHHVGTHAVDNQLRIEKFAASSRPTIRSASSTAETSGWLPHRFFGTGDRSETLLNTCRAVHQHVVILLAGASTRASGQGDCILLLRLAAPAAPNSPQTACPGSKLLKPAPALPHPRGGRRCDSQGPEPHQDSQPDIGIHKAHLRPNPANPCPDLLCGGFAYTTLPLVMTMTVPTETLLKCPNGHMPKSESCYPQPGPPPAPEAAAVFRPVNGKYNGRCAVELAPDGRQKPWHQLDRLYLHGQPPAGILTQ